MAGLRFKGRLVIGRTVPTFISVWDTTKTKEGSSANNEIKIPLIGTHTFTVHWGDGAVTEVTPSTSGDVRHAYDQPGQYELRILGNTNGLSFMDNSPEAEKLIEIRQWGGYVPKYGAVFSNCINLDITATDIPDVSAETTFSFWFDGCANLVWNSSIGRWNVGNGKNFSGMFRGCPKFNQDISDWDMSNAENISSMFHNSGLFDQPIGKWNITSKLTGISYAFMQAKAFNQDLDSWDVSNVTGFNEVFNGASLFNGNVESWNVGSGTSFIRTLAGTAFNRSLRNWDMSSAVNVNGMFSNATVFNGDVTTWNTGNITNMDSMFAYCFAFNQPIGNWDTSKVTNFRNFLLRCDAFKQDISDLNIEAATNIENFLGSSQNQTSLPKAFYEKLLISWSNQNIAQGLVTNFGNSKYTSTASQTAKDYLTSTKGMTIVDGGYEENLVPFISRWDTTKVSEGSTESNQVRIPVTSAGTHNNIQVNWGDGVTETLNGYTDPKWTHTYAAPGEYTITITGNFSGFAFLNANDKLKLREISQWGSFRFTEIGGVFYGCENLDITATDAPDTSSLKNFSAFFRGCTSLKWANGSSNLWNTGNGTNFNQMFQGCTQFEGDVSSWDVSSATSMSSTFNGCLVFNSDVSNWETGNVTNMSSLFNNCEAFNRDISKWDVTKNTNLMMTFHKAKLFNSDLSGWDVSNCTNFDSTFNGANAFTSDLSGWNVSKGTQFQNMFRDCHVFTSDLSGWRTPLATNMALMFRDCYVFQTDFSEWQVGNVTNFSFMFFNNAAFNSDISDWDVSEATNMGEFLGYSSHPTQISAEHLSAVYTKWSQLQLQPDIFISFGAIAKYHQSAQAARQSIIDNFNWTISDGGLVAA